MNVSSTSYMQQAQTRKMDGSAGGQGNGEIGKMMRETLSMLPKDIQDNIKSLMQTIEPSERKDAMSQMAEIETSNMTVEDLTAAIMNIFQPEDTQESSSFPGSFSAYA